jgi:hypothetical protein
MNLLDKLNARQKYEFIISATVSHLAHIRLRRQRRMEIHSLY